MKATTDFPNKQVPCLELADGTKLGQSNAIIRFLGHKLGFYPADAMEAYKVDQLMDDFIDVIGKVYKPHFAQDKESMYPEIFDKVVPSFLARIDERCAAGEFLVGKNLTCADFYIGGLYTNYLANDNISFAKEQFAACLEKFPNFKAYGERYVAATQKWQTDRPKYGV